MLNKSKAKFGAFVKSKKINVFGVFLILSFLMLVIIKLSESYDETLTYKLAYKNLAQNEVLALNQTPSVEVGVKGFGFYLFKHYFQNRTIIVDFDNDVYKGGSTYTWLPEKHKDEIEEQLGSGLKLNFIRPDTVRFPFEVLTVKSVPVSLDADVEFMAGYDSLKGLEIEPDSIDVIGSKEALEAVEKIKTQKLELRDISNDLNQSLQVILPKSSGKLKLSQNAIIVSSKVEKFTEGSFDIPITLINVPKSLKINYFPKQISVSFLVSLKNFKDIKPEDFEIVCDYKDVMDTASTFLIPELTRYPENVKNIKMRQKKVEYIINQ